MLKIQPERNSIQVRDTPQRISMVVAEMYFSKVLNIPSIINIPNPPAKNIDQ